MYEVCSSDSVVSKYQWSLLLCFGVVREPEITISRFHRGLILNSPESGSGNKEGEKIAERGEQNWKYC